jgi:hypothetical protein
MVGDETLDLSRFGECGTGVLARGVCKRANKGLGFSGVRVIVFWLGLRDVGDDEVEGFACPLVDFGEEVGGRARGSLALVLRCGRGLAGCCHCACQPAFQIGQLTVDINASRRISQERRKGKRER